MFVLPSSLGIDGIDAIPFLFNLVRERYALYGWKIASLSTLPYDDSYTVAIDEFGNCYPFIWAPTNTAADVRHCPIFAAGSDPSFFERAEQYATNSENLWAI